jgi:monoamine oxidase
VTEEEAAAINRSKAAGAAFNQRERDYLKRRPEDGRLSGLYLDRYIEKITDEYQPFGVGLDDLDALSLSELLQRDGASEAAIQRLGRATPLCTPSGNRPFCGSARWFYLREGCIA